MTVPTIGLFLAALALGYWSGGRIQDRFLERVSRNFLVAAFIAGVAIRARLRRRWAPVTSATPLMAVLAA